MGVTTRQDGPVLEVVLDRPPVNAIDGATSRALGAAFDQLQRDDHLLVGVLAGAGQRFFSAGWDLKAAVVEGRDPDWGSGGFGGLTERHDLDKPVVAAVNGLAAGGGFELALACDLLVMAEDAELMLSEVTLGLVPDAGGVLRLPRRVPRAMALEALLTGRRVGAAEAARWGLVNAVVPAAEVLPAARALARGIAANAPLAVRAITDLVRRTEQLSVEEGERLMRSGAVQSYQRVLRSDDALEGPRAFVERRPPVWRGR